MANGKQWEEMRKVLDPAFAVKALGRLVPIFAAQSDKLIRNWKAAAQEEAKMRGEEDAGAGGVVDAKRDMSGDATPGPKSLSAFSAAERRGVRGRGSSADHVEEGPEYENYVEDPP